MPHRSIVASVCGLLVSAFVTSGCTSRGADEMDWARAALARNPALEIIAVDEKAGVFTVKLVASGEVKTLALAALVAGPVTEPVATATTPATEEPLVAAAAASDEPALAAAATASDASAEPTVANDAAGTLLSGPGYSITRSAASGGAAARSEPLAPPEAVRVPTRAEPIICQGQRFMRIDGQTIATTGNAIVAEDGCDLHITKSRISAGGVAITVRNARIHVTNSTIAGQLASLEAAGSAEVYSTRSTFEGITKRFDEAVVNDLGGSVFR